MIACKLRAALAIVLVLALGQPVLADTIVFSTDFNSGVPGQFSGITTLTGVQGWDGLGPTGNQFSGDFLRNDTGGPVGQSGSLTTLTLLNLPSHTSVDVNFLLAVIDSWDGIFHDGGGDYFNVHVDGAEVFKKGFDQIYSGLNSDYDPGPPVLLSSGANLGFSSGGGGNVNTDGAYNMYLEPAFQSISHTSNTLTIDWFADGPGWGGGDDESWAIDNVQIVLLGTEELAAPEPATLTLLGFGIAALAGYGWRRRQLAAA